MEANVVLPYKKIVELFVNVDRIQGLHHEILLKRRIECIIENNKAEIAGSWIKNLGLQI